MHRAPVLSIHATMDRHHIWMGLDVASGEERVQRPSLQEGGNLAICRPQSPGAAGCEKPLGHRPRGRRGPDAAVWAPLPPSADAAADERLETASIGRCMAVMDWGSTYILESERSVAGRHEAFDEADEKGTGSLVSHGIQAFDEWVRPRRAQGAKLTPPTQCVKGHAGAAVVGGGHLKRWPPSPQQMEPEVITAREGSCPATANKGGTFEVANGNI